MIIPATKIYRAAATDKERPVLCGVHYNAGQQRFEAANGFIAAYVPVTGANGDPSAIIPPEAIKEAHKLGRKVDDTPALKITEDGVTPGLVHKPRWSNNQEEIYPGNPLPLIGGRYPDINQVYPPEQSVTFVVALNAKELYALAEAICEEEPYVELHLDLARRGKGPVLVKPLRNNGYVGNGRGVIMPMHSAECDRR